MEEITKNPFRILGLDINCNLRDAARAEEELLTAVRLGVKSEVVCDSLSALAPLKLTPESVSQSRYLLQEPKQKAISAFFWFIFGYSSADQVCNLLQLMDVEEARRLLEAESTSEDPEAVRAATHDLGLLELLLAHNCNGAAIAAKHYQKALRHLAVSHKTIGNSEISRVVSKKVLGTVALHTKKFVNDGELSGASCLYKELVNCHWDPDDVITVSGIPFGDLFQRMEG